MNQLHKQEKRQPPVGDTEIQKGFVELDDVVFKKYLKRLDQFPVIRNRQTLDEIKRKASINRIEKIVYDREENNLDKLASVFSSMALHGATVFILLESDGENTQIYLGTQSSEESGHVAIETFERSLKASFPGVETSKTYTDDIQEISNKIDAQESQFATSISGVPSLKDSESEGFVQGIEKIVEGMEGKEYIAIMLATPVTRSYLEQAESAYQELYSSLSFLESQQLTLSESQSETLGKTVGISLSTSLSNTIANTSSTSMGNTNGTNKSKTTNVGGSIASGAAVTGALLGGPFGAAIGGMIGAGASLLGSRTEGTSSSESVTNTKGETESKGTTNTQGSNESTSVNRTNQLGTNRQYTFKNRRVSDILEIIDEQLARIRDCKNHGMWSWGTYFISSQKSTVQIGADLLAGILSGESTGVERNAILSWSAIDNQDFPHIRKNLAHFNHPAFDTSSMYSFNEATPTSLVSTKELTVGMSLPQKSLPGVPVFDSVEFGRSVAKYGTGKNNERRELEIGSIIHLGQTDKNKVLIDIDSLTAHVFITGSTGAGKSNTIYSLLHSLWKKHNIPFLIIEPAKGEYKEVFGGYGRLNVFGTNASLSALLKLNPFSFPESIHVTEHIDRLIEILNAVWPMYAAMPAILKAGIEKAYENMGWDLFSSENKYGAALFPDFEDLLEVLPKIIEGSDYSSEMKGNYMGALVTRIQSLTNGYYRTIFQKDELPNKELFDKACIVDLSRVGSSETKSLLMGIIFMKLQEYRMSQPKGTNSTLKHITVLEEAHHLLRRTSSEQSSEGSNLQGKAVEMISNAIAEMRTYGEGFIIADQAPGLLDQSVIRNTNTKIILRLPDWDDRELVGKAANLKDEQIEEIARLRTGCAAVYQNEWQEAVLCQFDEFNKELVKPFEHKLEVLNNSCDVVTPRLFYRTKLIEFYLENDKVVNNHGWLKEAAHYYPAYVKNINNKKELRLNDFIELIRFNELLDTLPSTNSHREWFRALINGTSEQISLNDLSKKLHQDFILQVLDLLILSKQENEQKKLWEIEKNKISTHWAKELV